jgi:hypothetical protein
MRLPRALSALLLLASAGVARTGSAQASAHAADRAWLADSAVVQLLAVATIQVLAHDLADAALHARPRAWQITLPDSTGQWRQLRHGLLRALLARPYAANDSTRAWLSVEDVTLRGDSLVATARVGVWFACPDTTDQGPWGVGTFEIRAARSGDFWRAPEVEYSGSVDAVGCGRSRRR